jgi:hypothetical protein
MKNDYFLIIFGQYLDDLPKHVAHFMLVCFRIENRVKRLFGFKTGFSQFKLRKDERFPPQTPPLVVTPVDGNAAEPWIKRAIEIK